MYQINVKTAEPIGTKFCMATLITQRKVCVKVYNVLEIHKNLRLT